MWVPVVRRSNRQVHFFVPGGLVSVERLRREKTNENFFKKKTPLPRGVNNTNTRTGSSALTAAALTRRVVMSPVCESMENLERSLGPLTNVYVMVPPLSGGSLSNALTCNNDDKSFSFKYFPGF